MKKTGIAFGGTFTGYARLYFFLLEQVYLYNIMNVFFFETWGWPIREMCAAPESLFCLVGCDQHGLCLSCVQGLPRCSSC